MLYLVETSIVSAVGIDDGIGEGFWLEVGVEDGWELGVVGRDEGETLGVADGLGLGIGLAVGWSECNEVGDRDGIVVGGHEPVGLALGMGDFEGESDGDTVGLGLGFGDSVGCWDGPVAK